MWIEESILKHLQNKKEDVYYPPIYWIFSEYILEMMIEINLESEILPVLDMQISKHFLLAKGKEDLGKLNIS